jgi:hypothetical protein
MRTFELKDGSEKLTLDDAGFVTSAGAPVGTWKTNEVGQIVIARTSGAESTIDVGWAFNDRNHLTLVQNGETVFDFHSLGPAMPGLHVELTELFVKPDKDATFEFSFLPTWTLSEQHDLKMTIFGVTSTIDGFISDPNSAFRFVFVDKDEPLESFAFFFKGEWHNEASGEEPGRVEYKFEIKGSTTLGRFELPNKLMINPTTHFLAYSYDKNGRTRSVQLVGQFSFNNIELTYAIERRQTNDGNSTMLRFGVKLGGNAGPNGLGQLTFELLKSNGAASGTTLSITSRYVGRFKNGVLTLGFTFNQRTMTGTIVNREFVFVGALQHKGGSAFVWAIKTSAGTMSISLAASNLKLGAVTADVAVTLKMKDGSVQAVQVFVGLKIPKA